MVWNEDYTTPNTWQPANLDVGNTSTTVTVAHRHKPMQGDLINRDESRRHGALCLDGNALRNKDGSRLHFEVEKFEGDGFSCYQLRDLASKQLLYIDGDWMRLGDEEDIPEIDTLLCFERWEGFKPYLADYGEIAWHLWIKSRESRIHINDDGWLNSKDAGSLALFTFTKGDGAGGDELERRDGETWKAYETRLLGLMEARAGESHAEHRARKEAIRAKLMS